MAYKNREDEKAGWARARAKKKAAKVSLSMRLTKDGDIEIKITGRDREPFIPGNATDIEWLFYELKAQKKGSEQ